MRERAGSELRSLKKFVRWFCVCHVERRQTLTAWLDPSYHSREFSERLIGRGRQPLVGSPFLVPLASFS
ncbi:hypothetical protein, partial [Methylobacterium brachiatum]